MKNSFIFLIPAVLIVSIAACNSQKKLVKTSDSGADKSMTSLDWSGIYQGILPCADCPGIKTQLILYSDMTYTLKTSYMERGVGSETEGIFSWNNNGSKITLDGDNHQKYLVGKNMLFSLDGDGNKITGDLADRFILRKEKPELTGKNWKLIMLNGDSVRSGTKQPFMILDTVEKRISGNTGCNNFFGTYKLANQNGIIFSSMSMTKMACIGDNPEQEFMDVLEKTINYSLTVNELNLKDKSGNVLAKFEEDYFESLP